MTYTFTFTEEQMQSLNLALCFAVQLNRSEAMRQAPLELVSGLHFRRAEICEAIWHQVVKDATKQGFEFRNNEAEIGA